MEIDALERRKCCDHSSAFIFDWIVILAGNKDIYLLSVELKIRPDPIRLRTKELAALEGGNTPHRLNMNLRHCLLATPHFVC